MNICDTHSRHDPEQGDGHELSRLPTMAQPTGTKKPPANYIIARGSEWTKVPANLGTLLLDSCSSYQELHNNA